jgi:hypothetical protein
MRRFTTPLVLMAGHLCLVAVACSPKGGEWEASADAAGAGDGGTPGGTGGQSGTGGAVSSGGSGGQTVTAKGGVGG